MAGYSARQSSFTTGDTILAAHSNDEFNQVLAAFNATTGHSHDGTAGEGGPVGVLRDADSNNKVLVDTSNNHLEFYVEVSSAAVQQLRIQDGAIVPITDSDIDLGTSSVEFKDAFFDGTVTSDAFAGPLTGNVTGNVSGTAATVTTAAQSNITSLGTLTTLTVDNVIKSVSSVCPIVVPLVIILSTVNVVKVPNDVIFDCAAVVTVAAVPETFPVTLPVRDLQKHLKLLCHQKMHL